jgi:hypothetical protein
MTNDEKMTKLQRRRNSHFIISPTASPNRAAQNLDCAEHVRALKAAACRRTPEGASSDFVNPSSFVIRASSF